MDLSSLSERANLVDRAAKQLMNSEGLANVLRQMLVIGILACFARKLLRFTQLTLGNIMNEGTRQGNASGITLNSLLKLTNTKGADKKTTVQ